ncbi:unnamed protein product [Schistosoma curassoni]|nr:unnamed protein product [Schistosoma curassoni]
MHWFYVKLNELYINENKRLIQCLTAVKENVVADRPVTAPLAIVNVATNVQDLNNQTHLYGCGSKDQRVGVQFRQLVNTIYYGLFIRIHLLKSDFI